MAYTDVEMAILAQISYADVSPELSSAPDGEIRLIDFLNSENCQKILSKNLQVTRDKNGKYYDKNGASNGYAESLNAFVDKISGADYTIVKHINDSKQDIGTGLEASFANIAGKGTGTAALAIRDPENRIAVACRGTEWDTLEDPMTDVMLSCSAKTDQQKMMNRFVSELEQEGYSEFYFTGHSLGGNNAIDAALNVSASSKVCAVRTYNAPGFNPIYEEYNSVDKSQIQGVIVNYNNENDRVSSIFSLPGKEVIVNSRDYPGKGNGMFNDHGVATMTVNDAGTGFTPEPTGVKTAEAQNWGLVFKGLGVLLMPVAVEIQTIRSRYGSTQSSKTTSAAAYQNDEIYVTPRLLIGAATSGEVSQARSTVEDVLADIQELLNTQYPSKEIFFLTDLGSVGTFSALQSEKRDQIRRQINALSNQIQETNENLRTAKELIYQVSETIRSAAKYLYDTGQEFQATEARNVNLINGWSGTLTGKTYTTKQAEGTLSAYVTDGISYDAADTDTTTAGKLLFQAGLQIGQDIFGFLGTIVKMPYDLTTKGPVAFANATWSLINGVVATGSDAAALALLGISEFVSSPSMESSMVAEAEKLMDQNSLSEYCRNQVSPDKDPEDYDFFDKMWDGLARTTKVGDTASDLYSIKSTGESIAKDTESLLSGDTKLDEYLMEQFGLSSGAEVKVSDKWEFSEEYGKEILLDNEAFSTVEDTYKYVEKYFSDDGSGKSGIQKVIEEMMHKTDPGKIHKKVSSLTEDYETILHAI